MSSLSHFSYLPCDVLKTIHNLATYWNRSVSNNIPKPGHFFVNRFCNKAKHFLGLQHSLTEPKLATVEFLPCNINEHAVLDFIATYKNSFSSRNTQKQFQTCWKFLSLATCLLPLQQSLPCNVKYGSYLATYKNSSRRTAVLWGCWISAYSLVNRVHIRIWYLW